MIIPTYKGGQSNSIYDGIEQFNSARDLQVFNHKNTLKPNIALVADAGKPANFKPRNVYLGSDGKYYFLGEEVISATNKIMIYTVGTALSTSSTYALPVAGCEIAGSNTSWPLEEFAGKLYWGVAALLKTYDFASTVASAGASITTGVDFLKTHSGMGKLFYVHNTKKTIGYTSDGTTFTDSALVMQSNDRIVSVQPAGQKILVGVTDVNLSKKARILIWDGTNATVDDVIYLGEAGLKSFRYVNGYIEAICMSTRGLRIYKFGIGSTPDKPAATLNFTASGVSPDILDNAIDSDENILYFGLGSINDNLSTYSREIGLFGFGTNTEGYPDIINIDRLISTGSTTANFLCVKKFGSTLTNEVMIAIVLTANSTFSIQHTIGTVSGTLSANGVYESDAIAINGGYPGKLRRIVINHEPIPASTGFTVQIKQYGHYPWGNSVPAEDTFQDLITPEGSGSSTGKTQSTDNACMTEIAGNELFKDCRYFQLRVKYDEISGVSAPNIIFPINWEKA